jgi:hypothetical protein
MSIWIAARIYEFKDQTPVAHEMKLPAIGKFT